MIELNTNPTARELRQFSCIWFPVFCAIVGGLCMARFDASASAYAVWATGTVIAFVGFLWPTAVKPLFLALSYFTYPIGLLVSYILLAVLFYLVVTPIGLLLRLMGRDPLGSKRTPSQPSHWVERREDRTIKRYFQQF